MIAPLLVLLLYIGGIAAAPFSTERAYRDARAAVDRGLLQEAAIQANDALARAGPAEDEWVHALRLLQAEVQYKSGQQKSRVALELRRRELPPRFRNSEAAFWRLLVLAQAAKELDRDNARAREYGTQALDLAEGRYPRLLWQVHLSLSYLGQLPAQADAHLAKALQLARHDGNLLAIAIVRAAQSFHFVGAAKYREAIDAGEKALATLKALQATGRIASVAGNLGWAYSELGDWETAHAFFLQATEAAARAGAPPSRLKWENQLGNFYLLDRNHVKAEQYYTRALTTAREADEVQMMRTIQTNLARNELERGRTEEARRLAAAALAWPSKNGETTGASIIEARIATLDGDFARAERMLQAAMKNPHQTTRVEAQMYLAQLYVRMRRNRLAEDNFLAAIAAVRKARESIAGDLRLSFFNTSIHLFNSYIDFLLGSNRIEDALAATELIRAQSLAEGRGMQATSRQLDARALAKQRNAVLLSYWLSPARSHLWLITANGVEYAALPDEKEIQKQARMYRRALFTHNGTLANSGQQGQRLYRTVVGPVAARIPNGSRVYVISSGALHGINFETLVVPGTTPHYWIEDVIVSSATSLQLLARSIERNHDRSILLVGDPPDTDPAFPKLPSAPTEIAQVGRHFAKKVVLAGAGATPAAYRAASPRRFGYLHFVAHGLSSARPLDSCVILGRDAADDYKLTGRDILAQKLEARLVTLSSCHGAGERMYAGEGLVGLAWAFLGAGATEVIAALWEVNDAATPALMDRMYAGIAAGAEPAVALRNAKLTLLRGKGAHKRPRYWAPFVLYSGR